VEDILDEGHQTGNAKPDKDCRDSSSHQVMLYAGRGNERWSRILKARCVFSRKRLNSSSIFKLAENILGIIRNILTPFSLFGCSMIFS
jgi:hypothetical protein